MILSDPSQSLKLGMDYRGTVTDEKWNAAQLAAIY